MRHLAQLVSGCIPRHLYAEMGDPELGAHMAWDPGTHRNEG